jgi:hypothetical protein
MPYKLLTDVSQTDYEHQTNLLQMSHKLVLIILHITKLAKNILQTSNKCLTSQL